MNIFMKLTYMIGNNEMFKWNQGQSQMIKGQDQTCYNNETVFCLKIMNGRLYIYKKNNSDW